MRESVAIIGVLLIAVISCGRDPGDIPTAPRGAYQILSGLVSDDRGGAVAGASVRITGVGVGFSIPPQVSIGGCTGSQWFVDSSQVTSSAGRFTFKVGFGPVTPPLCIAVEVSAPTNSGLRNGLAWIPNVFPTSTSSTPDTTRVFVSLPRE